MSDSILSTNSRERSRQIENIRRVARGGKVEKKIFVQMEDVEEKKKRQEQILKEREAEIFTKRKLEESPKTLDYLSKIYDISKERVRQIENRAFEKVKDYIFIPTE